MKKNRAAKFIINAVFLLLAVAYIAKFAGPNLLKLYVKTGVGSCRDLPLLCLVPDQEIINPKLNKDYTAELLPYKFADMKIYLPKGFTVVKETVKKVYYKKHKRLDKGSVVYLLYEQPTFFIDLFPQIKKSGIDNNYKFLDRMMRIRPDDIKGLSDTFFVVMKSIFIPDLGGQGSVRMAGFRLDGKSGFISYSLGNTENYFNCDITGTSGIFFKVYIKDKEAALDLEKVLAVISTIK